MVLKKIKVLIIQSVKTMKQSITIISILLGTFILAFLTSLLLELSVVKAHWVRQFLVILLVAVQLAGGTLMLLEFSKKLNQSNNPNS